MDFNPTTQMATVINFSLFHGNVLGTPEFPLSDALLQEIDRTPSRERGLDYQTCSNLRFCGYLECRIEDKLIANVF